MNRFVRIIEYIEQQEISLQSWIISAFFLLFGRYLLENFSNRDELHALVTAPHTLVHYALSFCTMAFSVIFVITLIAPAKKVVAHKIGLYGLMLVWLAPILDLFLSKGTPQIMAYIMQTPRQLFFEYLTFFGPHAVQGATLGIRIEVALILLIVLSYIFIKTGSWARAAIGTVLSYTTLFILGSLPSIAFLLSRPSLIFHDMPASVVTFMLNSISNSLIPSTFLHPTIKAVSSFRYFEIYFDVSLSQIYFIILLCALPAWFFIFYRKQTVAILKNTRPVRVLHYFLMVVVGILLAVQSDVVVFHFNWLSVISFIILFATYFCAWAAAVCTNDLYDVDIDRVSNTERPLVNGRLSITEVRAAGFLFTMMALIGGFLLGDYIFYLILVSLALSYVYSAPPLRLHRVPFLSHFIIALVCLSAVLSGFYMIAANKTVDAFPLPVAAAILICFTLFTQMKDIKDEKGDRADGIHTLPTLLGEERGKMVIGALNGIGLFLLPIIFARPAFFFVTIPAIFIQWFLIVRKRFVEKYIFFLYFLMTISLVLVAAFIK